MRKARLISGMLVFIIVLAAGVTRSAASAPRLQAALGTAFTYQGQLAKDGQGVSGSCEMSFSLYSAASGGSPVGGPLSQTVPVSGGLFTVKLDFGAAAFDGSPRWLGVSVRCAGDAAFTDLPRQAITPAPYAITAGLALTAAAADNAAQLNGQPASYYLNAGNITAGALDPQRYSAYADLGSEGYLDNNADPDLLTRLQADARYVNEGQANSITTGMIADGTLLLADLATNGCTNGQVIKFNTTTMAWECADDRYGEGATIHSDLKGLDQDDHPQYFNLGQNEVVSGVPAFNGGDMISRPPFTVSSGLLVANLNADRLDGLHAAAFSAAAHTHANLSAGTGLSGGPYNGGAAVTLNVTGGSGILASADNLDLGPLTTNWNQTGPYDLVLNNASSELQILESTGGVYYGALDVGDLSSNQSYTFTAGGTVWTTGNDGSGSGMDADLLDGLQGSAYQQRVSGACPVGSTIRAIYANGSVLCQADQPLNRAAPPTGIDLHLVDTNGTAGMYTSVTISSDGLPIIAYNEDSYGDLRAAHCDDSFCTTATVTTIDSIGTVGQYASIILGADGMPLISYYDYSNRNLKVAHCENAACTVSTLRTVDGGANDTGLYTSITIGADGLPLIAYADLTAGDLKTAHCSDVTCASATLSAVDTVGDNVSYTSAAIGADGLPIISYLNHYMGAYHLRLAHCVDAVCSSAHLSSFNSLPVAATTSVVMGSDGLPLIAYYLDATYGLRIMHCLDLECIDNNWLAIEADGNVGKFNSMTIGPDGLPLISYFDQVNANLKVAHCYDVACARASTVVVDSAGDVGYDTSITIGLDGLPLISYYDNNGHDLKVAHCSNPFCIPFFRQR